MIGGLLAASIFTGKIVWNQLLNIPSENLPYITVVIVAIGVSELLFRNKIKLLENENESNRKIGIYHTASIMRWGILEGAGLFSLMMPDIPKINVLIILVYFILIRPQYHAFESLLSNK